MNNERLLKDSVDGFVDGQWALINVYEQRFAFLADDMFIRRTEMEIVGVVSKSGPVELHWEPIRARKVGAPYPDGSKLFMRHETVYGQFAGPIQEPV